MIAEAGLAALWIAAALSLLQLFFGAMALTGASVLPVSEAHGEGDHPKGGGGASSTVRPPPPPARAAPPPPTAAPLPTASPQGGRTLPTPAPCDPRRWRRPCWRA